ncbi:MAG: hypothetical protein VZT48_05350, partial [Bulleidia sp.]|nr:hypothetical protein [Bulleidia sp.]
SSSPWSLQFPGIHFAILTKLNLHFLILDSDFTHFTFAITGNSGLQKTQYKPMFLQDDVRFLLLRGILGFVFSAFFTHRISSLSLILIACSK